MQSDGIKNFLCRTSILSRMNADFCNCLLGIENSEDMLRNLEETHLLTFPYDEDRTWYHYHHLFQEFLATKLASQSRKLLLDLHFRAARLWEEWGDKRINWATGHFPSGSISVLASGTGFPEIMKNPWS